MSHGTTGLQHGALQPKDAVNYRPSEKCGMCRFFYAPNSCVKVEGPIAPEAVCTLYELTPKSGPIDGNFFLKERAQPSRPTGPRDPNR